MTVPKRAKTRHASNSVRTWQDLPRRASIFAEISSVWPGRGVPKTCQNLPRSDFESSVVYSRCRSMPQGCRHLPADMHFRTFSDICCSKGDRQSQTCQRTSRGERHHQDIDSFPRFISFSVSLKRKRACEMERIESPKPPENKRSLACFVSTAAHLLRRMHLRKGSVRINGLAC